MKLDCVFHYVLAILEGALSGVLLYEAEKAEHKQRKILLYLSSAAWFLVSLADSLQGSLTLKELRAAKVEEADNGGDIDE